MRITEIKTLLERIKKHYNTFGYDEEKITEWHRFLKDYTNDSVLKNFDNYVLDGNERPPIVSELIKNADKEYLEEVKPVYIQCDICGEKILVADEWDVFEKHHRRCQKIDFINRECKRIKGEGIDYNHYRTMSDDDLNQRYRKIMDNWKETHKEICLKNLFQKM